MVFAEENTAMDECTAYAVWPNDDRMPLDEARQQLDAGTLGRSDDWIAVTLTEEQAELMTYDEMIAALRTGALRTA